MVAIFEFGLKSDLCINAVQHSSSRQHRDDNTHTASAAQFAIVGGRRQFCVCLCGTRTAQLQRDREKEFFVAVCGTTEGDN